MLLNPNIEIYGVWDWITNQDGDFISLGFHDHDLTTKTSLSKMMRKMNITLFWYLYQKLNYRYIINSFSVPSRDCRNANVCLSVCLFVCHKRFLVWTWINWWIHGYYIQSFYFRIKQNVKELVKWIQQLINFDTICTCKNLYII